MKIFNVLQEIKSRRSTYIQKNSFFNLGFLSNFLFLCLVVLSLLFQSGSVWGQTNGAGTWTSATPSVTCTAQSSNYTLIAKTPNVTNCATTTSNVFTITFPSGFTLSSITGGTFAGIAIGTISTTATTVSFTATAAVAKNNSFTIVLNGLTNNNVSTAQQLSMTSGNTSGGTNTYSSGASSQFTLTSSVTPSVSISASTSTTICSGTSVAFTATPANGGSSPAYQWKLNGGNVGTNSTTYSNLSLANGDQVTCVLTSNATCASPTTATSNSISMTVNSTPFITGTTPVSRCGAGIVTLGATASAGTINWYAASTGGPSLGTGTSFTTPSISVSTTYYVDATSGSCTTASRTAVTATVNDLPSITGQPGNQTVSTAQTATFTVTATGIGLTYQWQEYAGANWSNITNGGVYTGSTTATLTITNPPIGINGYKYRCVVSGTCTPAATSDGNATLTVTLNYCTPTGLQSGYYINNFATTVGLTNITNNNSGYSANGYGNFMGLSASQYSIAGSTLSFSSSFVGGTFGFALWVDWNSNGTFELTERMYNSAAYVASVASSFNIPTGQTAGNYRMRIVADFLATSPDPCVITLSGSPSNTRYGEAEDYILTIVAQSPCSGTPSPGTVSISSSTGCAATASVSLSSAGYTLASGLTFQWQKSTDGGSTWANLGASTSSYSDKVDSPGQTCSYRLLVTCYGNTGTSNVVTWTDGGIAACYCVPTGATSASIQSITNVTFAGINNSSAQGTIFYEDFTSTAPGVILPGNTYPITVTFPAPGGANNSFYLNVFFDWNQDGDFADAGEEYQIGNSFGGSVTSATGNILVPGSALTGSTRMRVIYRLNGYAIPCQTGNYFNAEDYSISIPVSCSGIPTAGNTISSNMFPCNASNSFTLSLSGASIDLGITYNWQSSTDGLTYSSIGAPSSSSYATSHTSPTYYQCVLTCSSSGQSATSSPVYVDYLSTCYCQTASTNTANEFIQNVTCFSFSNTTAATTYSNYTSSIIAIVQPGTSVPISVKIGKPYNADRIYLYADWNDDGDFSDASEAIGPQVISVATEGSGSVTYVMNLAVPSTAACGNHRLRIKAGDIVSSTGGAVPMTANACQSSFTYGEVEDYTINTSVPSTLTSLTNADFVWKGNSNDWTLATNWYQYNGSSFTVPAAAPTTVTNVIIPSGSCVSQMPNTLTNNGNSKSLTIETGASLTMGSGIFNITGNWTNNGTFTPGSGTVNFKGAIAQSINGTGTNTFNNLTINNSSTGLTLNTPSTTTAVLTMTLGNIFTTSTNLLTVGTSIASPGSINWLAGTVVGPLRRWFNASTNSGNTTGLFPVGNNPGSGVLNRWCRLEYTSAPSTAGYMTVEFKEINPATTSAGTNGMSLVDGAVTLTNIATEGYWEAIPGALNGGFYSLTTRVNTFNTIMNYTSSRVIKSPGSHTLWTLDGVHGTIAGTAADYTISRTGMSNYSWFAIAYNNITGLPVELTEFGLSCSTSDVNVKWSTVSEYNSDKYVLENSENGLDWTVVNTVDAAGYSTELLTYELTVENAARINKYYRLIQIDNDGMQKTYGPIYSECGDNAGSIHVWPNPNNGSFAIELNGKNDQNEVEIVVLDFSSKIVKTINRTLENKKNILNINEIDLPPAVYILKVKGEEFGDQIIKLVIQ